MNATGAASGGGQERPKTAQNTGVAGANSASQSYADAAGSSLQQRGGNPAPRG